MPRARFKSRCSLLVVFGLLTRLAAPPLIIDMLVAIATTKVPILLHSGFGDMAHEARLDFAMLACSCVLLTVGAGEHSIDAWLRKRLGSHRADVQLSLNGGVGVPKTASAEQPVGISST